MSHLHKIRAALLGAASTALVVAAPLSQAADFSGKTIEWMIPFKAGGGSDKWSRFYAPLLSDALPGKPNVVVKNVPGGGSTQGANLFTEQARPDGLTIFGSSGSTQFPYLLDDPRVRYEYADWRRGVCVAEVGRERRGRFQEIAALAPGLWQPGRDLAGFNPASRV